MSESFSVGEIAIWNRPLGDGPKGIRGIVLPRGMEVTVVGALADRICHTKEGPRVYRVYEIQDPQGRFWAAFPHWLRKRYQPPDWLAIASKQAVPDNIDIKSPEYA